MKTYTRRVEWTVTIRRPDYTKSTLVYKGVQDWSTLGFKPNLVNFVSSKDKANLSNNYTGLISYEYSNSISNPASPFSLTITPDLDSKNLSWKDKIQARDIVFISEFGKVRYIGVVKTSSYSSTMNNETPTRNITISGESLGGSLQSFDLPMNKYLWYNVGSDNKAANDSFIAKMNEKIAENQSIGKIFSLIQEGFFKVNFGSGLTNSGFRVILDNFFELDADVLVANYPMNIKPFQEQSNTLWSMYRQVLPGPVYEIFGRFEEGKYKLVCREAPFDAVDWNKLKLTTINPLYLIEHSLSDSDSEVFTHYYSMMPNSVFSEREVYASSNLSQVSVFDKDKLPVYGYKQLRCNFPFYDLDKGREFSSENYLKKNSVRLFAWYKNNVEFQSGSITLHSVPDENNDYINIGERIKYLEGGANSIEFYVEGFKRKMTYPETMTSIYSITRGYEYSKNSTIIDVDGVAVASPQVKKISNLGIKLVKFEEVESQNG